MTEDWKDISYWNNPPDKYFAELGKKKDSESNSPMEVVDLRKIDIDNVKLYCLLKFKVSPFPNGFFTFLIQDKPIENLFWWDFVLESKLGNIHFLRKQSNVEAWVNVTIDSFDLKEFILFNFQKYKVEIEKVKQNLEKHTLYINHYDSYNKCVEELWKNLETLNLEPVNIQKEIKINPSGVESLMQTYMENNVRFHTYGKSLILNSAFKIESYLNLLIRITAKRELVDYPDVMKKHLGSSFSDKLKNLKFFSVLISKDVDLNNIAVQNAIKVMTYRNKYVHFDLSSNLNKIGEVHFDNDFPIFPSYKDSPIIENIKRSFQTPSFDIIKFCYESSNIFVEYIESLLIDGKWTNGVKLIMNQNPIGFNEQKKVYSAIFSNTSFDGFPSFEP